MWETRAWPRATKTERKRKKESSREGVTVRFFALTGETTKTGGAAGAADVHTWWCA